MGDNNPQMTWFFRLATVVLVVAILRLAQDVLIPIVFATLLAFLLAPLVVRLMRWRLPKTAAIVVTVSLAFAVIGGIGWLVASQAIALVRELPNYEQNLQRKIAAVRENESPGVASRVARMVENLRRGIQAPRPAEATPPPPLADEPTPVPVQVKATDPSPWQLFRSVAGPILRPLGVAGIIVVFVVAILFQREDLRDRVLKLLSAGQLNVATQALDDAASRVSRYLGMQLVVNASYGVPIGIGLYFIGIPNALLWGMLATLLRFIPFIGPWIAALFPLTLAIAVDPGWTMLLWVIGLFVVMELISNNIIEVVVYGATTGISNFALLVAAVFWTWLWGPAGLALSTPLTACLLVIGNYVPALGFLKMLLGSEPVLDPPDQFYQRMLSMESEDMLELANRYINEHSVEQFYDEVFLPALLMSEEDRHRGSLTESRQQFIFQASRELIEELEGEEQALTAETQSADPCEAAVMQPTPPRVLIIPARDEADEIAGLVLSHLLRRRGVPASVQSATAPFDSTVQSINQHPVDVIIVSALPPSTAGAVRHACRRLRSQQPTLPMIVGVWHHTRSERVLQERLRLHPEEEIVNSLSDALAATERSLPPGTFQPLPEAASRRRARDEKERPTPIAPASTRLDRKPPTRVLRT